MTCIQGHDLTLYTEEKNIREEGELAARARPAKNKNKFLAIRVPFRSRIEIPDPQEVASYYRALGYHEDMIQSYRINIDVPKTALSGSILGLVSRKEVISSNLLEG